ncbi:MAG: cysteine--tRNA ligase [bacterium]
MQLLDTLSNTRRELLPALADDGVVRLYVCGVTPYSESHVGHALHAIVFDVFRRYLDWRGIAVKHVQNFTDIDDKLIDRANRLGVPMLELAEQNIDDYHRQLTEMNVLPAHVYPRVTEVVPEIISFIEGLIAKGFAYESGGDVYYKVREFGAQAYGALSKRDIDDLLSGARIDPTELKSDPLDFALWKTAKPGEPSWESPWGHGRPGWHIECSAMALFALGEQIDVHGGGADLIFPHHTNEIAQTEAYTGKSPFARIWMHNALLQLSGDKMSKSIGNLVTIAESLEKYGGDALRMFVISSHYRSPSSYTDEAMDAAKSGVERLRNAAFRVSGKGGPMLDASATREAFVEAMEDDLNTPRAVAALFDLTRDINRATDAGGDNTDARILLRELCGVLGLTLKATSDAGQEGGPFIDLLLSLRTELRSAKQWQLADRVRDGLLDLGIEIKDGPEGTTWSAK